MISIRVIRGPVVCAASSSPAIAVKLLIISVAHFPLFRLRLGSWFPGAYSSIQSMVWRWRNRATIISIPISSLPLWGIVPVIPPRGLCGFLVAIRCPILLLIVVATIVGPRVIRPVNGGGIFLRVHVRYVKFKYFKSCPVCFLNQNISSI